MTIFELVKIALDELYAQGLRQHGVKLDAAIREQIEYLSRSYGYLRDANRKPVDYRDPATRFAYVYMYVAAHGDYLVQVLEKVRNTRCGHIFDVENIRVSCVGGGPGSDIVGLLKYLDENGHREPVKRVTCYLLDSEKAWADTWTELGESLETIIRLNANFQPLDVTAPLCLENQRKFLQADLFTMSYFVSEVFSLDQDGSVSDFWRELFREARPGALFVYTDNGSVAFNEYFDKICGEANKLTMLIERTDADLSPRYSEEKSELGDYLNKFNRTPKLKARVTYRVLQKT